MGVKLGRVTILRHDTTSTNEVECESMSGPSSSNEEKCDRVGSIFRMRCKI